MESRLVDHPVARLALFTLSSVETVCGNMFRELCGYGQTNPSKERGTTILPFRQVDEIASLWRTVGSL